MKRLFYFYSEIVAGEVWLDESCKVVSYVHENDASFRREYHSFIPEYFGGEVHELDVWTLTNASIAEDVYDYDYEDFVKDNKKLLQSQIDEIVKPKKKKKAKK